MVCLHVIKKWGVAGGRLHSAVDKWPADLAGCGLLLSLHSLADRDAHRSESLGGGGAFGPSPPPPSQPEPPSFFI